MLSSEESQLLAGVSGERAVANVSLLVLPPERVSGSEAEVEGAKRNRDLLAPYMDSCELEGVAVTSYLRGRGKLEVVSPVGASFPCEVNPVSAPAKGEGVLVDASGGTRADYEKESVAKDRIVLATVGQFGVGGGLGLIAREARHRGAACLVYHMPAREDDLISIHGVNANFPVLSISNQSAAELRRLLSEHKEVRVSFESDLTRATGTSYNVVGTIRGSQFPDEVIYLTSHHDTWFDGASDNNATTACLLEVARLLSEQRPKHTIKFVIHGSEECGADIESDVVYYDRGSFGYSEAHRSQLEGNDPTEIPVCVINGELLGYSPPSAAQCTPEVLGFVKEVIADLEEEHRAIEPGPGWTSSDHLCYHTLGTPTIYITPAATPGTDPPTSPFMKIYHTEKDDLEHISAAALVSNARLFTLLVTRLDAAEMPTYSLEHLAEAAGRDMEHVPNSQQIRNLLDERRAQCAQAVSREERLRRTLALARVVNKNIYGFSDQVFVHKFTAISTAIAKLKEACQLIDGEGNMERTRETLRSITGAMQSDSFSHEVLEELTQMRQVSPFLNRLSNSFLDLSAIFTQLARGEPKEAILPGLESQIEKCLETARAWGVAFEQSLASL